MISHLARANARWTHWAGGLPARKVVWGLAWAFCVWVALDIYVFQLTGGVSQASYDAMVRARVVVSAPDPRLLIIDIDEPSLKRMATEFGRWPWPRDTLATVLDYVEQQKPAAVVWDIVFSDADRLSPGGDAAFDAAVTRSARSHFSVTRLAQSTDSKSEISSAALPLLWAHPQGQPAAPQSSTVAVIPPALKGVAAGRLGYNNGYVDADGVLRRYRAFETLPDHSSIQSIAMATLATVDPLAYAKAVAQLPQSGDPSGALIAWRRAASAYPRVAFADVFAAADGGKPLAHVPDMAGKVIVIGATAASLHDIHPTPLAADHPGVDTLATTLDNAINQRTINELPRWLDALLAMVLCLGLAFWVQKKKMAYLAHLTLILPAGLLFVSYLTLNGSPVFVDLKLSAALALLFLALLRYWIQMRRRYWCTPAETGESGMLTLHRDSPWLDAPLDHLIDVLEKHLPDCRVVVPDLTVGVFQQLRWPELGCHAAIVGPVKTLRREQPHLGRLVSRIALVGASMHPLPENASRINMAELAMQQWSVTENIDTGGNLP